MLRAQSDGILTTNSTIKEDNSKMTCRLNGLEKFSPLKIIVDRGLKLNNHYAIFKNSKKENLIVYHNTNDQKKIKNYSKNADLIYIKNKKNFLKLILNDLANRKIKNLLIESGTIFSTEMIKANLVDQIAFLDLIKLLDDGLPFINSLNLKSISDSINTKVINFKVFDNDIYELRRLT